MSQLRPCYFLYVSGAMQERLYLAPGGEAGVFLLQAGKIGAAVWNSREMAAAVCERMPWHAVNVEAGVALLPQN